MGLGWLNFDEHRRAVGVWNLCDKNPGKYTGGGGEGKVHGAVACPEVDERENSCEMNWEAKCGDKKKKS